MLLELARTVIPIAFQPEQSGAQGTPVLAEVVAADAANSAVLGVTLPKAPNAKVSPRLWPRGICVAQPPALGSA